MLKWQPGAWALERHKYAPELNQAHVASRLTGKWYQVPLPQIATLEEAQEALVRGGHIRC